MSVAVAHVPTSAESRGWQLTPSSADPRILTLLRGGRVVHRLMFSSYAATTGELKSVGVTEVAARTLAQRITAKVVALGGRVSSQPA